jgi:hypothetical protein
MNSVQKCQEALARAESVADDQEQPQNVRIMANFVGVARPRLEALIPSDPEQLDEFLQRGADWMLSLRSD